MPHFGPFLAFSIIGTVVLLPLLVLPAMIGVLVDKAGMSDSFAGWTASAHFMASAFMSLALSVRVHTLNLRRVAAITLACAVIADLVSAFTATEPMLFLAARITAGLFLGAAYVSCVASFARVDGYERGFGLFVTIQFIVSGLGLFVVPVYADEIGAAGLFMAFAVMDCLALALCRYLPSVPTGDAAKANAGSELKILLSLSALLAAVGFALFEAANSAQFTYIERLGVAMQITDEQIGFSLLIASLLGIPGAFCIVVVGQRFGTLVPLVFGFAVSICGLAVIVSADSYVAYFIGNCCMGFAWAFCLPFIQSFLANIDRKGSALAAGTAFATVGGAIGPGVAALVITGGEYMNPFLLAIGLFVVTLIVFFFAANARSQTDENLV